MRRGAEGFVAGSVITPLLVYDGECQFCRRWVRRWERITGDRAEYRSFQEVAAVYPEIGRERFRRAVWLIEPGGRATSGARAVFRLFKVAGDEALPSRIYEAIPPFAMLAELVYSFVASHREAAGWLTTLLWGGVPEQPQYRRMRSIFLRGLGLVYLAAFASLASQIEGLLGSRGIAPASGFLREVGGQLGTERYWKVPTLLWIDASDFSLQALCWAGIALATGLMIGVLPRACLAGLWVTYLSLVSVGSPFLDFQWDSLLLETGLLGLLFAPSAFWLGHARQEPSRAVVWLIRWLVFRLMFLSGVVKLSSGDPAWHAWEAMLYHYETQPLPAWTSWSMHQFPRWFQAMSVGFLFWAELIAPFLVFGPRVLRMVAFFSIVTLQLLIALTGNYGFFNLMTVVLCLSLVEDRDWGNSGSDPISSPRDWRRQTLIGVSWSIIVAVTTMAALDRSGATIVFPAPLESLRRAVEPFRSLNAYGLFAVMTTERPEIIVEGSDDGISWKAYEFRWKPGEPSRPPRFSTPHMPRLDWQMWFAALGGDCRGQPWFLAFERRLLEGSPQVRALLAGGPFTDRPPQYVRARLYAYRFTRRGEKNWWVREELGSYCPAAVLSDLSLSAEDGQD